MTVRGQISVRYKPWKAGAIDCCNIGDKSVWEAWEARSTLSVYRFDSLDSDLLGGVIQRE
ncbi:hypothetical protein E4U32_001977 [Claviceps aff. humidiphila group G2b]|nr:hypothetical protein E4U32_001977 [Claviceps aff. humidiphila group G2b]